METNIQELRMRMAANRIKIMALKAKIAKSSVKIAWITLKRRIVLALIALIHPYVETESK